jgi:VIT1/CCC1 family predicted Fe2+/Mn2+ transporter
MTGMERVVPAGTSTRTAPSTRGGRSAAHKGEPHAAGTAGRLNWLRAGVLGANDGIVSVAGIVVGVAGASAGRAVTFTAGLAGLVAGAVSMALGEYVSVSSQRDSEAAQIAQETRELADAPDDELDELTALYAARGLSLATARQVAEELTARDALTAHLEAELKIEPEDLAVPAQAAAASALSFTLGALLPLVAILLPPDPWRVPVCIAAVLVALALTGAVSAKLGGSNASRAVLRVLLGGALGLALTYGIGHLFGATAG